MGGPTATGKGRARVWLEAALVFALALAVRLPHLDHPGEYDEYYHALAARTWLESGSLDTEAFTYRRADLWSIAVAGSFAALGDDLAAARVPGVLAGCFLAVAAWAFGRRVGGSTAGWIVAILLCFDFESIRIAQSARFYAGLGLVLFGSAAALYLATAREPSRRWPARVGLLAASGAFAALAFRLNHMSAIAFAGLGAWAAIDLAPAAIRTWRDRPRLRWPLAAAGLATAVAAFLVLPDPRWVFEYYRESATYNAADRSDLAYYLYFLVDNYAALCALLPLAVLFGLRDRGRFTGFALTVLAVGFALHSGAGRKEERYVLWAMPLFFLVLAVGAARARPHVERLATAALGRLGGRPPGRLARTVPALVFFACVAAGIGTNRAYRLTPGLLATPTEDWPGTHRYYQPAVWDAAAPTLRRLAEERCALVSSAGVKALYHLGRLDYDLLRTLRDEHMPDHIEEFVIDHRTHRPTISEPASLEEVARRHPSGVVVVENAHWRMEPFVSSAVADLLESGFEPVEVPREWRLRVYVWGEPGAADCPESRPAS